MRRLPTVLVLAVAFAGCTATDDAGDPTPSTDPPETAPLRLTWASPVDLQANGYEPSISVDSQGILYLTAHKELNRPQTWPYPASWMLMSRDGGATWTGLDSPAKVHEQYLGDEGDIAIDGRDWVYFLDTYLGDNHLHAWSDQGAKWEFSKELHSTAVDDRPWIAAQGDGILHYLGNNGANLAGGRYWYYRSTDAGTTWTAGTPVQGNGWCTVEADRRGDYAYIVTESRAEGGDVKVLVSDDRGATWGPQQVVAKREDGNRYPVIDVDDAGNVYILYSEAPQDGKSRIHLARSTDHGVTWTSADITPFDGYIDYPWLNAGPAGLVGVGFYATRDLPLSEGSKWYVYGGAATTGDGFQVPDPLGRVRPPALDASGMPRFDFTKADPDPVYVGMDTHALHDFMEVAVGPDGVLHLAYQYTLGKMSEDGERKLHYVHGTPG